MRENLNVKIFVVFFQLKKHTVKVDIKLAKAVRISKSMLLEVQSAYAWCV
jgi:hypothetical protein